MIYRGFSWTITAYHGISQMIMDYCGLSWILKYAPPWNRMNYKIIIMMHPKNLTTPEKYVAGMAHTVASIGHGLSCSYCGLLWIAMDYRLSWTMMDYHGLSLIMGYSGLSWIIMDYGPSWTIVDFVANCGSLCIVEYAPRKKTLN